jgi:hypothetical protein
MRLAQQTVSLANHPERWTAISRQLKRVAAPGVPRALQRVIDAWPTTPAFLRTMW